MDLNDVWQGNRRFILGVGCAVVLVLIGKGVVGSIWDAPAAARGVERHASGLRREEAPRAAEVAAVTGESSALAARLEELYARLAFVTEERYLLPKNEPNPDLLYNAIRGQAREDLVEFAARRNIRVKDTLGLPDYTPDGKEAIQRYLRGLCVVEQVVSAAIVAEVRAVDGIEIVEKKGRARQKSEVFVEPLEVRFEIAGTTAAIAELIDSLVRGGEQFLCVEDFMIEPDQGKSSGLTVLKLTVSALTIDPAVQVTGAKR
ncbi:MAG: hypothetical protein HY812_00890 [Planctomycetes bacterium]|nr:hypothetical protein [Planctomycetota bacterium]